MTTERPRQPIALAVPLVDPAAQHRAALRVAYAHWRQVRRDLADARAELADAVHAANVAGLSYRQIGRTLDRDAMFAHRVTREGRHTP